MSWTEKIARYFGFVPVSAIEDMNKVRRKTLAELDSARHLAEARQVKIEELEAEVERLDEPNRQRAHLAELSRRAGELLGESSPAPTPTTSPLAKQGDYAPMVDVTSWIAEPGQGEYEDDGTPAAIVIQIDTNDLGDFERVRVNLNEATIWDGNPETDERPGAYFRA